MCRKCCEIVRFGSRGAVFFFLFTGFSVLDAVVNGVWNLDKVECVLFVKRQLKKSKSHEKECRLVSGEE